MTARSSGMVRLKLPEASVNTLVDAPLMVILAPESPAPVAASVIRPRRILSTSLGPWLSVVSARREDTDTPMKPARSPHASKQARKAVIFLIICLVLVGNEMQYSTIVMIGM